MQINQKTELVIRKAKVEVQATLIYFRPFLLVSNTFSGFPALENWIAAFKWKLLFEVSNSVLPEREIREMCF